MEKIDGNVISRRIRDNIYNRITATGIRPSLSVILVGNNASSHVYVNLKERAAREAGILFNKYMYDQDAPEADILTQLRILNYDDSVHAVLVQLPLPKHLNQYKIISTIDPRKDVDGFHPANTNAFARGQHAATPVLVKAIRALIDETRIDLADKKVVILANSTIFADPMRIDLERSNARVTMFAPTPTNIPQETHTADILITALGRPHIITDEHIKAGAIIIDVGITKLSDGKIVGDVDAERCEHLPGFITPVPGGVGPVTVAQLLANTLELAEKQLGLYDTHIPIGL